MFPAALLTARYLVWTWREEGNLISVADFVSVMSEYPLIYIGP